MSREVPRDTRRFRGCRWAGRAQGRRGNLLLAARVFRAFVTRLLPARGESFSLHTQTSSSRDAPLCAGTRGAGGHRELQLLGVTSNLRRGYVFILEFTCTVALLPITFSFLRCLRFLLSFHSREELSRRVLLSRQRKVVLSAVLGGICMTRIEKRLGGSEFCEDFGKAYIVARSRVVLKEFRKF